MKHTEIKKSLVTAALYGSGDLEALIDAEIRFYGSIHAPGDVCHASLCERLDEAVKACTTITGIDPVNAVTALRRIIDSLRFACREQADEGKRVWNLHAKEGTVNYLVIFRNGRTNVRIPGGNVSNCEAYSHAIQQKTGARCVPVRAWTSDELSSDSRLANSGS